VKQFFFQNSVRTKFTVPENTSMEFDFDSDGCHIDAEDMADLLSCGQPFMILCGNESWSKKCKSVQTYMRNYELLIFILLAVK
jgi:hypothetical protein